MVYSIFILVVQLLIAINVISGTDSSDIIFNQLQKCKQSGFTLRCNFIPAGIPDNITAVYVDTKNTLVVNKQSFHVETWSSVEILHINNTDNSILTSRTSLLLQSRCFHSLAHLQHLNLHSNDLQMSETALEGLSELRNLDLTACSRLSTDTVAKALQGKRNAPNLETINLSRVGMYTAEGAFLKLNSMFFDILFQKPITKISATETQIGFLDLTHLCKAPNSLKELNISRTIIGQANIIGMKWQTCKTIKTIDASYTKLPADFLSPGKLYISNISFKSGILANGILTAFVSAKVINITGVYSKINSVWIENVTLIIENNIAWTVEELIANDNNIRRLNCHIDFGTFPITTLSKITLNNNLMNFIHPSVLAFFPNLKIVELSRNRLHQMAEDNYSAFGRLLSSLHKLKEVDLSDNNLKDIPITFFQNNTFIEKIDLSENILEQINFDLKNNVHLKVLNLKNNNFLRLSANSLNNLNNIIEQTDSKVFIDLRSNVITCDACDDKPSMEWILNAMKIKTTNKDLKCMHEGGRQKNINDKTLQNIQRLCQRKVTILVISLTSCFILLVLLVISKIVHQKNKKIRKLEQRNKVLENLRTGENMYEFVAFLGYSSEDEGFISANVLNEMNQTLQEITGITRNLVCTGDQYFRPGHMVHNEISACLDRVCTMVIVVTDSYCSSVYCRSEFDQAYLHKKPIILMLCGDVNLEMMPPAMIQLYNRNARILWAKENGEYVLKTTWANVCSSILDLIK